MMMGAELRDGQDEVVIEDDIEIEHLTRERRLARGLRVAARRAVGLARRYRDEEGPRGQREIACVTQALAWRSQARDLRNGTGSLADRPGLARTITPSSPPNSDRRAG